MLEAKFELQLEVWKELAVSKQMLIRTAANALKLEPDCTEEEFREAVERLIKQASESEAAATASREHARKSIAEMEHKLNDAIQARAAAEAALAQIRASKEKENLQLATEQAAAAKERQKAKETIAEKDRALKAITTALADKPENVLKKMKELKKQKQEEADARKMLEATLGSVRTAKREGEQKARAALAHSGKLVTQFRELHALATALRDQLKPLVTDGKPLPLLGELDTKMLEEVEQAIEAKGE